jgi:hypothetical protein
VEWVVSVCGECVVKVVGCDVVRVMILLLCVGYVDISVMLMCYVGCNHRM